MCNFRNFFANGGISCPNMTISKKGLYLERGYMLGRGYMHNVWTFCQWPRFMLKYINFKNRPVSQKPQLVESKISSTSAPWGKKRVYLQLLELCQLWTLPHRAKLTSRSTPWCRKRMYVQLLELLHVANFMPKYVNFFEKQPITWIRLPVELNKPHFDALE